MELQTEGNNYKNRNMESNDEKFVPRGAIAFLIALLILGAIIFFSAYFLQVSKF